MMRKLLYFLLIALLAVSCSKNKDSDSSLVAEDPTILLPFSVGKINSVYVYMDESYSNNPIKDSITYYFDQPYLLTPNMAPAVDLIPYSFTQFMENNTLTANNLALVNVAEDSELSRYAKQQLGQTSIAEALAGKKIAMIRVKNINARPQQLFYLISDGIPEFTPELRTQIEDYAQTVIEETTELDNTRMVSTISRRRNTSYEKKIRETFGVDMWIPKDYSIVLEEENFLWFIRETRDLYSSFMLYKVTDEEDSTSLLAERAIPLRNQFGEKITTHRENTRMTTHTQTKPYPIQRNIDLGNTQAVETRGLWRMENDYLGGAFANYTFTNTNGELIGIDGFVYYAEEEKRRQMRDIDAILSTVEIVD